MRVRAKRENFSDCPQRIREAGFLPESQTLITIGDEYEVFAMAQFEGVLMFQIIDTANWPGWLPSWLFENVDKSIPDDWICTIYDTEPEMLIGPDFVAKDQAAYTRMVELDSESQRMFWERVKRREEGGRDEE